MAVWDQTCTEVRIHVSHLVTQARFLIGNPGPHSQTPNFNAKPVVAAILDACRRGVECTLFVCLGMYQQTATGSHETFLSSFAHMWLGYNEQGEMLPMQGGTNSRVYMAMCDTLNREGKRKFLKACWYTAKDRDRPIDAAKKERNCHSVSIVCLHSI